MGESRNDSALSLHVLAQSVSRINAGDVDQDIHQSPGAPEEQLKKLGEKGEQAAQHEGDVAFFECLILF